MPINEVFLSSKLLFTCNLIPFKLSQIKLDGVKNTRISMGCEAVDRQSSVVWKIRNLSHLHISEPYLSARSFFRLTFSWTFVYPHILLVCSISLFQNITFRGQFLPQNSTFLCFPDLNQFICIIFMSKPTCQKS